MTVLTLTVSHAASCAAMTARRVEALPEWDLGKVTLGAGTMPPRQRGRAQFSVSPDKTFHGD